MSRPPLRHWMLGSRPLPVLNLPLAQASALLPHIAEAYVNRFYRLDGLAAVMQAVRLHHTGLAVHQDLRGLLLARAVRRWPALTQRDSDVVMALMDGLDTAALAARLGLTASSAQIYCQRVYRKLGVTGQRELVAALLEFDG